MSRKPLALLLALTALLALLCGAALAETNTQVKHYLLLGEDGYAEELTDDARTDTIVLVTLDEKYNRVIMTSILRDSAIVNPRGATTKANLLFKGFGFDGVISSIEAALGIRIEGAVLVNFAHVKPVIDALGGVDLEITADELYALKRILLGQDPNMPEAPGLVHMTGRIALAYMRVRSVGSGDFSRTERQRKVVAELFKKCRGLSLFELIGVYNEVSSGLEMSLSALDILSAMRSGYALIANDAAFTQYRIPEDGLFYYGSVSETSTSSAVVVNWQRSYERFHALLDTPPEE